MSDAVDRLNAALEGRYRVEREIGEGGMATVIASRAIGHHAQEVCASNIGRSLLIETLEQFAKSSDLRRLAAVDEDHAAHRRLR